MEENRSNISRNQIHEKLMICTYQYLIFLSVSERQELDEIINSAFGKDKAKSDPFVRKYLVTMIKNLSDIVADLSSYLKEGWRFERLAYLERAILILGYVEYKYLETPKPVICNICVKLAKKFAEEDSYKFINAILENVK